MIGRVCLAHPAGRRFRGPVAPGQFLATRHAVSRGGIDTMIEKLGQTRKLLTGILLIPMLLLVGCGAEPTATTVPAAAPTTAATDTAAPAAAATNTTAPAAATDTAPAATATEAMAGTTPTEAAGGGASTEPTPAPTPVSQWVPGKYAKTIPAPSKLVKSGMLTVGSDASYPPQEYVDASGKPI